MCNAFKIDITTIANYPLHDKHVFFTPVLYIIIAATHLLCRHVIQTCKSLTAELCRDKQKLPQQEVAQ